MSNMEITESLKVTGHVKIYELPPDYTYEDFKNHRDKEGFLKEEGKNTVVTIGIYTLLDYITLTQSTTYYIGVGTSSTAVAVTDTDLIAVTSPRVAVTDTYRIGNVGYFDTFFGKNDNNATWAEAGLFNALTGNYMIARKLTSFSKSTSNACVVSWQLTLS